MENNITIPKKELEDFCYRIKYRFSKPELHYDKADLLVDLKIFLGNYNIKVE